MKSNLSLNRVLMFVAILGFSSAVCVFTAISAEPPKSYIDLNPVKLSPAQAPLTVSGLRLLSARESKYKENLSLSGRKAVVTKNQRASK